MHRGPQHSDYPYHGGSGQVGGYAKEENLGTFPSEIPFGLQFNTCITDFTPENGGTCFRLGSRDLNHHPNWGAYAGPGATQFRAPAGTVILYDSRTWHRTGMNLTDRNRCVLLLGASKAAKPACACMHALRSMLLGLTLSFCRESARMLGSCPCMCVVHRVAILNACIPQYIVPMGDQQDVYKQLASSAHADVLQGLTERERADVVKLMAGNLNPTEAEEMMASAYATEPAQASKL